MDDALVKTKEGHRPLRILLVEDQDALRSPTGSVLRNKGFTVMEACNGKQALSLAKAEKEPFDLVITDVIMPEMGGEDLANELHTIAPETKILFISGYTVDNLIQNRKDCLFLEKPFTATALLKKVQELLASKTRTLFA